MFVVGPRIDITSNNVLRKYVAIHEKITIPKVHKKFYLNVNFFPFINNSSNESLDGKTHNGAAKKIQIINATRDT